MIKFSIPVSIRDRSIQMQFDDGKLLLQVGAQKIRWYIAPPRERGPIEKQQMNLPDVPQMGVYESMVLTSTVSHRRYSLEDF